jgi:hypothetical protein
VGVEPEISNNEAGTSIEDGTYSAGSRTGAESGSHDYDHLRVYDDGKRSPDDDPLLFHRGNRRKDTRACYLPGKPCPPGSKLDVCNSAAALAELVDAVKANENFNKYYEQSLGVPMSGNKGAVVTYSTPSASNGANGKAPASGGK